MGMDGILAGYILRFLVFQGDLNILIDFLVCHHIKRLIIIYVLVQLCGKKGRGSSLGRVGRAIDW